jgi:proteasome activator subunit 4
MELLSLLADKTFSERGYSGTGRLIQRVLNTLVGVYPLNARFVNTDVWNSEGMNSRSNISSTQLREATQVSTGIITRFGGNYIGLRMSRSSGMVG